MDSLGASHRELRPRLTAAGLFLCTALVVAATFLASYGLLFLLSADPIAGLAALASPLVFLCACVLVFRRPRLGYRLGLVAGLMALPWLVWSERLLYSSSWAALNLNVIGDEMDRTRQDVFFSELKILSVLWVVIATACAALRLLPSEWTLRNSPVCRRTWPVFAVGLLVLAAWWAHSAIPYRLPLRPVDERPPEWRVLHVEKHGFSFHETVIAAGRNGSFYVGRGDRRLFQYRFQTRVVRGVMPQTAYDRTMAFVLSPRLWDRLHTAPEIPLRSWNAEGWYLALEGSRLLAFTSESKTTPPREVTDLFHEIENLPGTSDELRTDPDVSLGFGHDPLAALGLRSHWCP
jgi:hypothetical protein